MQLLWFLYYSTIMENTKDRYEWHNPSCYKKTAQFISDWKKIIATTLREHPKELSLFLSITPIFSAIKNILESVSWQDKITDRTINTKEKIAKTLSGVLSFIAWSNFLYGYMNEEPLIHNIWELFLIEMWSWIAQFIGIYYSWELRKILNEKKLHIQQGKKILQDSTQRIIEKLPKYHNKKKNQ